MEKNLKKLACERRKKAIRRYLVMMKLFQNLIKQCVVLLCLYSATSLFADATQLRAPTPTAGTVGVGLHETATALRCCNTINGNFVVNGNITSSGTITASLINAGEIEENGQPLDDVFLETAGGTMTGTINFAPTSDVTPLIHMHDVSLASDNDNAGIQIDSVATGKTNNNIGIFIENVDNQTTTDQAGKNAGIFIGDVDNQGAGNDAGLWIENVNDGGTRGFDAGVLIQNVNAGGNGGNVGVGIGTVSQSSIGGNADVGLFINDVQVGTDSAASGHAGILINNVSKGGGGSGYGIRIINVNNSDDSGRNAGIRIDNVNVSGNGNNNVGIEILEAGLNAGDTAIFIGHVASEVIGLEVCSLDDGATALQIAGPGVGGFAVSISSVGSEGTGLSCGGIERGGLGIDVGTVDVAGTGILIEGVEALAVGISVADVSSDGIGIQVGSVTSDGIGIQIGVASDAGVSLQAFGPIVAYQTIALSGTQVVTVSDSQVVPVVLDNQTALLLVNSIGSLGELDITLPTNPRDGQLLMVANANSGNLITLGFLPSPLNAPANLVSSNASLAYDSAVHNFTLAYSTALSEWVRVG
jgi:hypothetical protein